MSSLRVTIYHDPLNAKSWIVAKDDGDPSEEIVLAEKDNYSAARAVAEKKATELDCEVIDDECVLL